MRLWPLIIIALLDARTPLHLPPPSHLSLAEVQLLTQRMGSHASDLDWLVQAAIVLDYSAVETSANNLIGSTRLPRPADGETGTLSSRLPKRFFNLQDRLVQDARAVATAARANDPKQLGLAVGDLIQTCVACHSSYLEDPDRLVAH